jgi:hypothetical protein
MQRLRGELIRVISGREPSVSLWRHGIRDGSCNARWRSRGRITCFSSRVVAGSDAASSGCVHFSSSSGCNVFLGWLPRVHTVGCNTCGYPVWQADDSTSSALSKTAGSARCIVGPCSTGGAHNLVWSDVSYYVFSGATLNLHSLSEFNAVNDTT